MAEDRLKRLAQLAAMVRDKQMAALSQSAAKRNALAEAADEIRKQRQRAAESAAPDAAHRAGIDATWGRWSAQALSRQSQALIEASKDLEDHKHRARRAFGRAQALKALRDRERNE